MMQWAHSTIQDIRFALRCWRKTPAFTITAVATLALGIGANTAIFSVVSGVLLRPLPYDHPENLVQLGEIQPPPGGFHGSVVYRDFEEWRTHSKLLEGMATYIQSSKNLQGAGEPEQVTIVAAERGVFPLLGVAPLAGRTFDKSDPMSVAVVSYGFWKDHFGGDQGAIGRSMTLDGQPFTLIGVMPPGFQFPYGASSVGVLDNSASTSLWIPWDVDPDLRTHPDRRLEMPLARLKPGVTMQAVQHELSAMESPSQGHRIVYLTPLQEVVSGPARYGLLVLLGAVAMVMLVACVNVANLLLARTASRGREITIRAALGASRIRLLRQLLTESFVLALGAGTAGLFIGIGTCRLLLKLAAAQIPRAEDIGLDWRVFMFLLTVCVITAIGIGVAPSIAAARGSVNTLNRARGVLRDTLVVIEVALAFVLLAGAGLLAQTFLNLQRTDPGLNADNVLTAHVVLPGPEQSMAIEERVAQIPGVRAAGLISLLPLQNSGWNAFFTIPGYPDLHETELRFVTPGYFRAMGIPLRRGREFSPRDDHSIPVLILINEALANKYFPNEDPIGRLLDRGTIIGVVGDVRQETLRVPAKPEIYYAVSQNFGQMRRHGSTLAVRTDGPPERLIGAVRAAIREVSPGEALFRVATMQSVIEESLAEPRLYAWLLGIFAAMGTLLAMVGIYGVIAYIVTLRTREFGIRMALGADPKDMLHLVMDRGAWLITLGLGVGIALSYVLTRVLRGILYGVSATDSTTFAAMAGLLAVVALAACLAPARRAAQVDPAIALRVE